MSETAGRWSKHLRRRGRRARATFNPKERCDQAGVDAGVIVQGPAGRYQWGNSIHRGHGLLGFADGSVQQGQSQVLQSLSRLPAHGNGHTHYLLPK